MNGYAYLFGCVVAGGLMYGFYSLGTAAEGPSRNAHGTGNASVEVDQKPPTVERVITAPGMSPR